MVPDYNQLESFYATALGKAYCHSICRYLLPQLAYSRSIVSFGYADPYLKMVKKETQKTLLMPAYQGVSSDLSRYYLAAFAEEGQWPLSSSCIDTLIINHSFEYAKDPDVILREGWRVLKNEGTLLLIVPNFLGTWSIMGETPLRHAKSYTGIKLKELLQNNFFEVININRSIYTLPFSSSTFLSNIGVWEKIGEAFFLFFQMFLLFKP